MTTFTTDQGVDGLDEPRHQTDDKVRRTCRAIRSPCGAGVGKNVSTLTEDNLKLAMYYINHLDMTQRTTVIANIILTLTRALEPQSDL